jgi:hypothetical protein
MTRARDTANIVDLPDAKGDLYASTAADTPARLAVGTDGQVLTASSGAATGLAWANGSAATLTTTGDTLYASSANTLARRAIGTTGQVLTVSGGLPTWAAPASGGITLISTTTMTSSSQVNLTSIPSTYKALKLVVAGAYGSATAVMQFRFNNDSTNPIYGTVTTNAAAATGYSLSGSGGTTMDGFTTLSSTGGNRNQMVLDIFNYADTTIYKFAQISGLTFQASGTYSYGIIPAFYASPNAITQINILINGNTFNGGTAYLYGVN